jgi:RHS repeat-associated protein
VISVTTAAAGQVVTPTFSPDGADYVACANSYTFDVTIFTTTSGAQIRWTTDGTPPTPTNGNLINASSGVASFTVGSNQTKTLQAMAYEARMTDSGIHSADFTFEHECGGGPGYPLDNAGLPPAGPVAPDLSGTFTYTLNKAGNRTAVNGVNYSPNSINQYTSVGGTAVTNGPDHEIQAHYGFTYHYMRDQELKQITATGFTYDFAYDALGRCVKRTVNNAITTYYFYDGEKPILEYNENNALVGFNLYGKGIDEIIERGAYGADNQWHWYFLNQDHEGSVTYLTDADGTIIEKYRYDAFGTPSFYDGGGAQITTSAYSNRFLFTGREYLGAWIYDYRARLYHAYLGRFMSEDPKLFDAGDYNLFRYCHNDPIDLTDPMGLWDMGDVKEAAYSLWYAGPRATFDAQSVIGNTTGKFAVQQGMQATNQYGKNPNAGEAVRHEVWQAELARKYGEKAAKAIGDAHEKYKSHDSDDSRRDQYHNQLGRENAKTSQSREDSLQRAKKDWESGRAARDKFDPRLEKASDTKSDSRTQKPPDASSIEQRAIQQGAEKAAEKVSNTEHGLNPKPQ